MEIRVGGGSRRKGRGEEREKERNSEGTKIIVGPIHPSRFTSKLISEASDLRLIQMLASP